MVYWLGRGLGAFITQREGGADDSSFVELGCAIPVSGGAQAYLAYSVSYFVWKELTVSSDPFSPTCTHGVLYPP